MGQFSDTIVTRFNVWTIPHESICIFGEAENNKRRKDICLFGESTISRRKYQNNVYVNGTLNEIKIIISEISHKWLDKAVYTNFGVNSNFA